MGHKNKESLIRQVEKELKSKLKIGASKYEDKKLGITHKYIYSWSTFRNYLKISCRFVVYCKEKHNCKTVVDCRKYANEWLSKFDSPYTQKTYVAGLCKLYGEHSEDFLETKVRERANIIRSRNFVSRDKHFSKEKNYELENFCKATGLRRKELENIRGTQLELTSKGYVIHVKGKGGKWRTIPICANDEEKINVITKMLDAGEKKVWGRVHSCADIHSYRRVYCKRVYEMYKRPLETLPKSEKYFCRKDKKGVVYDRKAMKIASEALGHSRISVIAEHYL